jgi:hypothetical protein
MWTVRGNCAIILLFKFILSLKSIYTYENQVEQNCLGRKEEIEGEKRL